MTPRHSPSSSRQVLNLRSMSAAPRSTAQRPFRSEVMNPNDRSRRACPTCCNHPSTAPELYDTWLPLASPTTTLRIHGVGEPATATTMTDLDHALAPTPSAPALTSCARRFLPLPGHPQQEGIHAATCTTKASTSPTGGVCECSIHQPAGLVV